MKWRALILGGGGSTGEFQMGALEVISKEYDSFDFYIGLGVGSLNGTVLAQYDTVKEGYASLWNIWNNIKKTGDILDVPLLGESAGFLGAMASDKGWARDGVYGNKKLKEIIAENIDWNKLKNKSNWAIETTSLTDGQTYTVTNSNELLNADKNPNRLLKFSLDATNEYYIGTHFYDFIKGAGSVPLMLPPVDIFGHRFVEGGVRHFIPLQLAVKAYQQARKNGYTEAEFVVINNYLGEPQAEGPTLLDSGLEISMRGIKVMTMEIALHDLEEGNALLNQLGVSASSKVIVIEPTIDYRLNPMDFDSTDLRKDMREHGISIATTILHPPDEKVFNQEELEKAHSTLHKTQVNSQDIATLVKYQLSHPEESFQVREKIAPHTKIVTLLNEEDKTATGALAPQNLEELIAVMMVARTNNKKIKAVGAGYAFSQILEVEGVQISLLKYLNGIWNPDYSVLKDVDSGTTLIEFEAGATIDQLNQELWTRNKALVNQPGYEKLSFLGVASCGGHGSGINIGPLSESICSIHLLTFDANGKVIEKRIEKTIGITDPAKFKDQYPAIELVQDDTVFNACKVSMGCMGIIYSLIITTQDSFYLQETRTLGTWKDLKYTLSDKLADKQIHSIHIWFNPYKVNNEITCVLSEYQRIAGPASGHRSFGSTFNGDDKLAPLLLWIMEHFPNKLGEVLNESLKAVIDKEPVIMPCTEALNFGAPNLVKVVASNCGIPADDVVEVADKLFDLVQERFSLGAYITSPIGFRFTNSTDAFFAPQYGRRTCMIEMPLIYGTDLATETITAFLTFLITDYQGRPHWGQRINEVVNKEVIKEMYPDSWKSFVKVYNQLNDGSFDGKFTAITGLRELVKEL